MYKINIEEMRRKDVSEAAETRGLNLLLHLMLHHNNPILGKTSTAVRDSGDSSTSTCKEPYHESRPEVTDGS